MEELRRNNNTAEVFLGGKENKHDHGVGFLVHKDIVNAVVGYRSVSSRLITIRLRAVPFKSQ